MICGVIFQLWGAKNGTHRNKVSDTFTYTSTTTNQNICLCPVKIIIKRNHRLLKILININRDNLQGLKAKSMINYSDPSSSFLDSPSHPNYPPPFL